jgi:predicted small lipoprotein YifL
MAGTSQLMTESFGYMIVALILAVLLVYMILAAQFESFIHPFTIMMSLPLAVVGAFGALYLPPAARHLRDDRAHHADGPRHEERDPARRLRAAAATQGVSTRER